MTEAGTTWIMENRNERDDQHGAEQIDESVLGGPLDDQGSPGRSMGDYPPDQPLGVEDPAIVQGGSETADDLVTREWRHGDDGDQHVTGVELVAPENGTIYDDDVAEAVADAAPAVDDPAPEEAAIQVHTE